jgi:hypothetical protein
MPRDFECELPRGASALIALIRVTHRNGDRRLERATRAKLLHDFGIKVRFPCEESVARDWRRLRRPKDPRGESQPT